MAKKNSGLDVGDLGADLDIDTGLPAIVAAGDLTDDEKRSLEAEARQELAIKEKAEKMEAYKASIKKELRRQSLAAARVTEAGEAVEDILIDLAKYTRYIMIDGQVFYHGYTYKFGAKQAAVIKDQIHRSHLHDAEIHGMDINEVNGRRKYLQQLRPS